jgi:hypothetical protein
MSPPTTRTASGTALPLNKNKHKSSVVSSTSGGVLVPPFFPSVGPRPGANIVAGFFDRARRGVQSLAGDEKTSATGRSGGKALRSASLGGSERKGKGD